MIVDGVRDDLISRRAAWEAFQQMHGITEGIGILKIVGRGKGEMVDRDKVEYMLEELDPAPIQPPARIEAAIRYFDQEDKEMRQQDAGAVSVIYARYPCDFADLLHWILTGEKDQDTWKNEDFGLEEEK